MDADQVAFVAIPVLVGLALLFTAVSLLRRGDDGRGRSVKVRDVERPPEPPVPPAELRPEQAGAVVLEGVTPTTEIVQYSGDVPAEIDEPVYRIVVEELSDDEKGVTRRMFFNRAITGFMSVGLGSFGLAMLMFLWPPAGGGFGSKITTNRSLADIKASLEGRIEAPVYFPEARTYVLPWTAPDEGQFEGRGVIVEGVVALYQRCVHLGCRVPWCASSQGFECPCHGSKYNRHGEYVGGPAPRNLDRFRIAVTATGFLEIDTALPVETPRAPRTTVEYPQGPNCL